jgi:hypothetical protein
MPAQSAWRDTAATEAALTERDADSMLFAPDGLAGLMQSIARHHQYESLRDTGWVGYL